MYTAPMLVGQGMVSLVKCLVGWSAVLHGVEMEKGGGGGGRVTLLLTKPKTGASRVDLFVHLSRQGRQGRTDGWTARGMQGVAPRSVV